MDSKLKSDLAAIFNKYPEINKVILFGSRARGDNKEYSDVDLCLFGDQITHLILAKISMDIYELNTPLKFDVLWINELSKQALIENIKKEGIVIYE